LTAAWVWSGTRAGADHAWCFYFAIGMSGKFNHTVGVRNAGTVVGINPDPEAPLWEITDIGFVGDWAEVFEALIPEIAHASSRATASTASS